MNVFNLRNQLVADYGQYVRSYIHIQDTRIADHVAQRLDEGMLWPEPLIQLNPSFQPGAWIDGLVAEGVLHKECANVFRKDKTPTSSGERMRLHMHQEHAARTAKLGVIVRRKRLIRRFSDRSATSHLRASQPRVRPISLCVVAGISHGTWWASLPRVCSSARWLV